VFSVTFRFSISSRSNITSKGTTFDVSVYVSPSNFRTSMVQTLAITGLTVYLTVCSYNRTTCR